MNDRYAVAQSLLDWANTFMQLSLNDFHRHSHAAGLTFTQMVVLLHLHYQGPCEVSRFCELLQVSPAGASQMIERLVQLEVVQRLEVPGDRRLRLVEMTPAGQKVVEESITARQAWVQAVVQGLSPAQCQQVQAAMQTLNALAGRLASATPGAEA